MAVARFFQTWNARIVAASAYRRGLRGRPQLLPIASWPRVLTTVAEPLHPAVMDAIVEEAESLLQESQQDWIKGDYLQCAEKCQRVSEEILGPARPSELREALWQKLASAYINGACALKTLDRYEDALRLCEQGLQVMNRRFSQQKSQVIQILDLIAELCLLCGQVDQADKHISRAIQIKEAFPWRKGALAISWNLKAQSLVQRGDLEAAKALFRRSLAAHVTAAKGTKSSFFPVGVAVVLSNYAGVLKEQKRYGEAAQMYGKAVEILESHHGADNEAVGRTLVELGAMYVSTGLHGRRAVEPLTRAMVVLSSALGVDHPSVQATMAWLGKCRSAHTEESDDAAHLLSMPEGCPIERLLAE